MIIIQFHQNNNKMKKINSSEEYYLFWKYNPAIWNENLETLKRKGVVTKINGRYYSKVTAHYSGDFEVVDCTCDNKGNFYPIYTDNLKQF